MRLRPYTTVLPKPLVPVGDRPILEMIIQQLARSGFRAVDLCVGHLGELIQAYFGEGATLPDGIELRYHWEEAPRGTAGALHEVEGLGELDEPFLVMNGDLLTTLDFGDLMRFHSERGAALTIAATQKDVGIELGVIEGDGEIVTGYVEKPTLSYTVSMGIYAYDPVALRHIPRDRRFDFPDVVLSLVEAGERVMIYPFDGAWYDIGTLTEHETAAAAIRADPDLFEPGLEKHGDPPDA
jgi:NDP-sugar pyrophosphorylase family protein